ncbi:hypothetical protein ACFL5V_10425 [Fibrobacterota bacterium]
MVNAEEAGYLGRRPKSDDFDDLDPSSDGFTGFQEDENINDDEEDEEINLDNPDFQKGEMWSDYADDMDFEE